MLSDRDLIEFNETNSTGAGCSVGAMSFDASVGDSLAFWWRTVDNRAAREAASVGALEADVRAAHEARLVGGARRESDGSKRKRAPDWGEIVVSCRTQT